MEQPTDHVVHEHKSKVVGWINVRRELADDVLSKGFFCRDREHVPISFEPFFADCARRQYESPGESVSLEVHGLSDELLSKLDRKAGHFTNVKHLPPQYLRKGVALERGMTEFVGGGCPYCGRPLDDKVGERMTVGIVRVRDGAFLVCPCENPACQEEMKQRQQRLDEMVLWTLYHATSRAVADKIWAGGAKMLRGHHGMAGGGIYFAHTPRETEWKAEGGLEVVLECQVKMGRFLETVRDASSTTFRDLVHRLPDGTYKAERHRSPTASQPQQGPYDSIILDRGNTGYPVPDAPVRGTRKEDLQAGEPMHPGYEFVVYSWDQVVVVREVERDPVPS